MQKLDFIQLVEQRLADLEARLTQLVDHRLTDEVKKTLSIARVDLPFSLAKARYISRYSGDPGHLSAGICRGKSPSHCKPLFNMMG